MAKATGTEVVASLTPAELSGLSPEELAAVVEAGGVGSEVIPPLEADIPVTVKISGTDYTMSPEAAAALYAREDEFNKKLSEHSAELGDLRKRAETPAVSPEVTPSENIEELLFENPRKAVEIIEANITENILKQYNQMKAEQDFFTEFYKINPDINRDTDHFLVESKLKAMWNTHQHLSLTEFSERLANEVRSYLLSVRKTTPSNIEVKPNNPDYSERSTITPPKAGPKAVAVDKPQTLSEMIKKNRKLKYGAPALRRE